MDIGPTCHDVQHKSEQHAKPTQAQFGATDEYIKYIPFCDSLFDFIRK
jgi:hypothetical protein